MSLPLEILADLQLAVDGENIDIQANGDRIVVDLPSLQAVQRLVEAEPIARRLRKRSDQAHEALDVAGLTLEVRLEGQTIAIVGAEATPSRLGRLLRLDGVELRATQTVRQVVRQRPFLAVAVIGSLFVLIGWLTAWMVRDE